jgi:hypothetical protein
MPSTDILVSSTLGKFARQQDVENDFQGLHIGQFDQTDIHPSATNSITK